MTFLLIATAWIFLLAAVVGLCRAARAGDRIPHAPVHVHVGEGQALVWAPAEAGEILARGRVAVAPTGVADSPARLAHNDSLAA
jgi:hypothetical protein